MPLWAALGLNTTRQRVAALFALALVLYVVLTALALRLVVFPAFEALERQDAISQIERVDHALQAEQAHLASFSRDWAYWDDSYNFVAAPDPDYLQNNLTEEATANTPTDLIALFDPRGDVVHAGIYRALSGREADVDAWLHRTGVLHREIVAPIIAAGGDARLERAVLIDAGGVPLIAVGHPILRSDRSGPANGVFLMARLLDATQLQILQTRTLQTFQLQAIDRTSATAAGRAFVTRAGRAGSVLEKSRRQLELRLLLPAADGAGFEIITRHVRKMTRQGVSALVWAALASSLTFMAMAALFYYRLLAPTFLRPLAAMTAALRQIEGEHDTRARLPVQGAPELQEVALAFNALMKQVEDDREEISLLSLTDELTRLPNRRRFEQVLQNEWHTALRQNKSLAVLICDVDHFKAYNDHYGHPTGDDCLRRIAQAIERALMRRTDVAARYGGEEFVVILPDTDAHGAITSAERIAQAVRDLALPHSGSDVAPYVTLSVGLYAATPDPQHSPSHWLALADAALYRAKARGRNRVEQASASDRSASLSG